MRSNQTPFEHILWEVLRANRFENLKFKRQVLIGNYIADFVCEDKKLIIELDGSQHGDNQIISIFLPEGRINNTLSAPIGMECSECHVST